MSQQLALDAVVYHPGFVYQLLCVLKDWIFAEFSQGLAGGFGLQQAKIIEQIILILSTWIEDLQFPEVILFGFKISRDFSCRIVQVNRAGAGDCFQLEIRFAGKEFPFLVCLQHSDKSRHCL